MSDHVLILVIEIYVQMVKEKREYAISNALLYLQLRMKVP